MWRGRRLQSFGSCIDGTEIPIAITEHDPNGTFSDINASTVIDWYSYLREVVISYCERNHSVIGGEGKIVEIDESAFGARKYHRGRHRDTHWVFGGVERDSGKCFFAPVANRSKEVLLDIIKQYILPGTTIYSDCWKAYNTLADEGYIHMTVNHSINFKVIKIIF